MRGKTGRSPRAGGTSSAAPRLLLMLVLPPTQIGGCGGSQQQSGPRAAGVVDRGNREVWVGQRRKAVGVSHVPQHVGGTQIECGARSQCRRTRPGLRCGDTGDRGALAAQLPGVFCPPVHASAQLRHWLAQGPPPHLLYVGGGAIAVCCQAAATCQQRVAGCLRCYPLQVSCYCVMLHLLGTEGL